MTDAQLTEDPPRAVVAGEKTPPELAERAICVPWALTSDGRKQPRAPHIKGNSYPAPWNAALPDDEYPATDLETVEKWTAMNANELEEAAPLPDDSPDDTLKAGLILPVDRPPRADRITLIDWDDVRDPETGELHPVAAKHIRGGRTYAEVSQSGAGVHQFVIGGLRDRGKFIAEIDDDPFVGDETPQVEIYDGGRHVACTRKHVEGTPEDVARGQDMIDDLLDEYATGDSGARSAFGDYDIGDPPEDRPTCYHAALQARADPPDNTDTFTVNSYAAMLGIAAGYDIEDLLADFEEYEPGYGFDQAETEEHLETLDQKMRGDVDEDRRLLPPSPQKLWQAGILPDESCQPDCPLPGHGRGGPGSYDGDLPEEFLDVRDDLSRKDEWEIWSEHRSDPGSGFGGETTIPAKALWYIAENKGMYDLTALGDVEELPPKAHNRSLWWVENTWADDHLEDDEEATARSYKSRDSAVYTWEDVRYIYEDSKDRGRHAARQLLSERYEFMTEAGSETLHLYDEDHGVFTEKTGPVRAEIYEELGDHWSTHELNEIKAGLRQLNEVEPRHLNAGHRDEALLCLENGVLDLYDRELHEHSPEYHFTNRVPVEYDPDAETETYEEFVGELVGREADAKALFEMVGHALVPDANERYKKFLILTGDADNGKSMFYSAVETLLNGPDGEESNTAGVKLAKLAQNRFSIYSMYGALANIAGEIDGKKIRNTANLKDITGGDEVEIEPKGQDSFFDTLGTTLMFAANDPPILGERDKKAIASRIVPVELPYTFVEDPDPDDELEKQRIPERELKADLEDPEALSGLLNLALDGLERLEANGGDVSLPEAPEERLEQYERSADPMREFGTVALANDADDYLVKADITTLYKEFASRRGYEVGSNIGPVLHGVLRGVEAINYTDSKPREPDYSDTSLPLKGWSERKEVVDRVTLTEKGLELAEAAGLVVDEDEKDDTAAEADGQPALAARDPQYGATFEADVRTVNSGEYNRETQGRLAGEHGTYIRFVVPGGNDIKLSVYEGERVRLEDVTLRTDDDGLLEAVIDDDVDIERLTDHSPSADTDGHPDAAATADGGQTAKEGDPRPVLPLIVKLVQESDSDRGMAHEDLVDALAEEGVGADRAEIKIEKALNQGDIYEPASDHYRTT